MRLGSVERLSELSMTITTILNDIEKIESDKPRRLVLDILSDVLLFNKVVNTRKWLREIIAKFKEKGFTVVATMNAEMHTKEEVQSLLDIFDGQIDIYEKVKGENTRYFLKVKRLYNHRHSTREIPLIRENLFISQV